MHYNKDNLEGLVFEIISQWKVIEIKKERVWFTPVEDPPDGEYAFDDIEEFLLKLEQNHYIPIGYIGIQQEIY